MKAPYRVSARSVAPRPQPGPAAVGKLADLVLELMTLRASLVKLQDENKSTMSGQMAEMDTKQKTLVDLMRQVAQLTEKIHAIQKGEKGEPGIQGKQGPQGIRGKEGPRGPQGPEGKPGRTPIAGLDFLIPEAELPPTPLEIIELFLKLPPGERLTVDHIDGFKEAIVTHNNQTRQGYFHGSGIPSLVAGSNITLAPDGNGGYIISSTGGSGGSGGFNFEKPASGTIDGSNTVFTFVHAPAYIVINQQTYFNGAGYSLSGLTATFDFAPVANSNITSAYRTGTFPSVTWEVAIAVQSGADVTIDLTQLSQVFNSVLTISRNGQLVPFSVAGSTATITQASASDVFQINYSYTSSTSATSAWDSTTGTQSGTSVLLDLTTLSQAYNTILAISRNGQIQTPGSSNDWVKAGSIVTVNNALASDVFLINYLY